MSSGLHIAPAVFHLPTFDSFPKQWPGPQRVGVGCPIIEWICIPPPNPSPTNIDAQLSIYMFDSQALDHILAVGHLSQLPDQWKRFFQSWTLAALLVLWKSMLKWWRKGGKHDRRKPRGRLALQGVLRTLASQIPGPVALFLAV